MKCLIFAKDDCREAVASPTRIAPEGKLVIVCVNPEAFNVKGIYIICVASVIFSSLISIGDMSFNDDRSFLKPAFKDAQYPTVENRKTTFSICRYVNC